MPATVPTKAEFDALEARVAALEGSRPTDPVDPPPSGSSVPAKRIADLIELFGVNTFSSLDQNNLWGSWPADYRPSVVADALKYLTANTSFRLRIREYHYASRTEMQRQWLNEIALRLPGTEVAICVGANGTDADVPTLISLFRDISCNVIWMEGLNEPNTDFGQGMVPADLTIGIQEEVWNGSNEAMGPSIVAGMPNPQGWIEQYFGNQLDEVNLLLAYGNGHYYPPRCPDLIGDGTSINDYVGGLWEVYNERPIMLTEFHPTLYNADGNSPDQPGWDGRRDAYYTLLTLFRCSKNGTVGLWWYALFDYGTTYRCGLFPKDANNPRPAADVIRNLCQICDDPGSDRRSFTPGTLGISVSGLPEDGDWGLYQRSDGRFIVTLWRSAAERGALDPAQVTVSLDQRAQITEWDLFGNHTLQQIDGTWMSCSLDADARVITIDP